MSLIYLAGILLFVSCEKDNQPFENELESSYQSYLAFKEASNNHYQYVVSDGTWAGYSWNTTLVVNNGEVVERRFQYTLFNDVPMPAGGWTLEIAEQLLDGLGDTGWGYSHLAGDAAKLLATLNWTQNIDGLIGETENMAWPIQTLDDVYESAKSWLSSKENVSFVFETDHDGIISTCGFYPDGCMDDCFTGIRILSIKAL